MSGKELFFFDLFLNLYHKGEKKKILDFLPREFKETLNENAGGWNDLASFLNGKKNFLSSLHYSWLVPALNSFSRPLRPLVVATLTQEQINGLKMVTLPSVSKPVKIFLRRELLKRLKIEEPLPPSYLPESEFSLLLGWEKHQIVELIECVGLYDLASELRQVVDKNSLKNVFKALSAKQFHCLKYLLHQKERLTSTKLGVDLMNVQKEELQQLLHQRGLLRFAKALFGESYDFVQHLAYRLDSGRGRVLLKQYQVEPISKVTLALKQQVSQVINFLKSE